MSLPSTQTLRDWWAPPCRPERAARIKLNGAGVVVVRGAIVDAVLALNACLVAFHYLTRSADTGAYVCRGITLPGGGRDPHRFSLHAYLIALDINWSTNPYGPVLHTDMPIAMIEAIERIRTKNGKQVWRWGGRYSGNKDAMHFEIVCSPADLATGLDPRTLTGAPKPAGYVPPRFPGVMSDHQGNPPSLKVLQQLLIDADVYHGPIDGKWSTRLGDGVVAVKRAHDELLFFAGEQDLSKYWGTYHEGVGTFDRIVGSQTWAMAGALARRRKTKR